MRKPLLQHLQSKRPKGKPHLRSRLPHGAKGNSKARPSRKAQAGKAGTSKGRVSQSETQPETQEVDGGATSLITIQRESDGKWKWDCYDRYGLKTGTQEKCQDALQALEGIIQWLSAELVEGNRPGR